MCRYTVVQKIPAGSCPFYWMFPSQCIPEVTGDFNVHFIVYIFIVDKTLCIGCTACLWLPAVWIINDSCEGMFMPTVNLFFFSLLPYHIILSRIPKVFEGDL
jgi:hypothetical protein